MDDISRLLRLARLQATLDKRCLIGGSTRMDVSYGEREVPFHVLLEGECDLEVGGVLHRLTAGDVVVLPSGARHRIITPGAAGRAAELQPTRETAGRTFALTTSEDDSPAVIDLFCGHYTVAPGAGSLLFASLPTPMHVSLFRSEEGRTVLTQLSSLMRGEAALDGAGSAAIMSAFCTVLLALVLRSSPGVGAHGRFWTAASDPRIGPVIEEVVADPGGDWSVERASRRALISRATFFRRFQHAAGMSFGRFLTRVRMMAASDLLLGSGLSVSAVGARVGYRSEAAFTRAFRAEVGDTPAHFRRAHAGHPA
jgi:AraC family transcriptional activator of mtrCDE